MRSEIVGAILAFTAEVLLWFAIIDHAGQLMPTLLKFLLDQSDQFLGFNTQTFCKAEYRRQRRCFFCSLECADMTAFSACPLRKFVLS